MKFRLRIWRQLNADSKGRLVDYEVDDIAPDTSFLEMLDGLNESLIARGEEPIVFESDCREGICGTCCLTINGVAHGPEKGAATCQLYMRSFRDGDVIYVEPWRARAFPVIRDLMVDREPFERILRAGGYVSVNTGSAPEANASPIAKPLAEVAMDAASCIGCGACVAACPNASAMLFVAAKVGHLARLPQGQPERTARALRMVTQMEKEAFGHCTNHEACEAACPKEISVDFITDLNRDYLRGALSGSDER